MLPTRDTLHPTVECLEFGEGEPNTGKSFGTAEWERGHRIDVGTTARSHECGEWDNGGREEGRILVQKLMSKPIEVVPVGNSHRTAVGSIFPTTMTADRTSCDLDLTANRCSNTEYHKGLGGRFWPTLIADAQSRKSAPPVWNFAEGEPNRPSSRAHGGSMCHGGSDPGGWLGGGWPGCLLTR